jgi:small subunit ribosomal protein S5
MAQQEKGYQEEVIDIRVHTKVTKGGRNLSFAALAAVGDGKGKVAVGYGKASGVPMAIEKATKRAREEMKPISMIGDTVAHQTVGRHGSTKVLIKPASLGTGVKAGATVRSIMSVVGINNVLTKCFGQNNPLNVAKATMKALTSIRSPEEVEELRGVSVRPHHPQRKVETGQEATEETEEQTEEAASEEETEETEEAVDGEETVEAEGESAEEEEAEGAEESEENGGEAEVEDEE